MATRQLAAVRDQAEVRPHIDARAHKAAKYAKTMEKSAYAFAKEMLSMANDGMSTTAIAEQVTAAGFKISQSTVSNHIQAIAGKRPAGRSVKKLPAAGNSSKKAFAKKYKEVNHPKKKTKKPSKGFDVDGWEASFNQLMETGSAWANEVQVFYSANPRGAGMTPEMVERATSRIEQVVEGLRNLQQEIAQANVMELVIAPGECITN